MDSGMVEAGAVFAALIAALRVIEKLVDQKLGKNSREPVQIDLDQTELANQMGQMVECLAATGQTLERINDKIDDVHEKSVRVEMQTDNINRLATETSANVFKLIEENRLKEAEERGRAQAIAQLGDSNG